MIDNTEVNELERGLRRFDGNPSASDLYDYYTELRALMEKAIEYLQTAVDERETEEDRANAAEEECEALTIRAEEAEKRLEELK